MGFDVYGPLRHVKASNIDDGTEPQYDILVLPGEYNLHCPQLANLSQRFYDSTTIRFANGGVHALRDELLQLRDAYRRQREPELVAERRIRVRDPQMRESIVDQVLKHDAVYRVLEEFRLLCEEAILAETDIRCVGD